MYTLPGFNLLHKSRTETPMCGVEKPPILPLEYLCDFFARQFMYRHVNFLTPLAILPRFPLTKIFTIMKPRPLDMYMYNTVSYTHKVATIFVNTARHYWNAVTYEIHVRNAGSNGTVKQ